MAWEEMHTATKAAEPTTIINAWARLSAVQATAAGFQSVESQSAHFYMDHKKAGAKGKDWATLDTYWWDLGFGKDANVTAAQRKLMLGGEVSMWSDHYCE